MNIKYYITAISIAITSNALAIGIDEALERAHRDSYEFHKIEYSKNIASHDAYREYLSITPNVYYNTRREDTTMKYSINADRPNADFVSNTSTFGIDQNLSIHKMIPMIVSAKYKHDVARYNLDESEKDVKIKFLNAFLDVYKYKQIIPLLTKIQQYLEKNIEIGKIRLKHGQIRESDFINLEYKLSEIVSEKLKAIGEFEIAKNLYKTFIGDIDEKQSINTNINSKIKYRNFQEYLHDVLENNSKIKSSKSNSNVAYAEGVQKTVDLLPDVKFAVVKNRYQNLWYLPGFPDLDQNVTRLEVNVPIYDSGAKIINASKSIQNIKLANVNKYITYDDVYKSAIEAWQMRDAYKNITENYTNLLHAMNNNVIEKDIKQEGKIGSLGTLLDSRIEKNNVEIKLLHAKCNYILYSYRVLFLLS